MHKVTHPKERNPAMSYVDSNLLPGESVTFRTTLHWWVIVRPLVLLVLAWKFSGGLVATASLFVVPGVAFAALGFMDKATAEFAVTNKRVILKTGVLRRRTLDVHLGKIEGLGVEQGLFARLLGFGTLVVGGTGGTKQPFRNIASALEFRRAVQLLSSPTHV
jgi:uncharacterized membrane protein YdbT with pleckstrin-like domain